ncbi:hypothetical protein [Pseudosporangium ferrugineum]|uniref:Uncharacterized protein n=1 Tax=Pseudosporangium ferrugineum TaxID=439699 RepID=A0A2T0SIM9_9ACTN|nr:hypothetical protein [Pseudosporangium ferrugineum]PRY33271.1 hypothetical protein CLV70_101433 [Pseudosporangium ferrugineum]
MNLSEVAMAAAITVSISGVSYAAFHTDTLTGTTLKVAQQVTCRTVDEAIVAYAAEHGGTPARIGQLRAYVKGDISAYRIVRGQATGPGCRPPA